MQAGGRRFEPDRLHHVVGLGWRYRGEEWVSGLSGSDRRWRGNGADPGVASPCGDALFFVRVNQVLVRLWACLVAMSDR